ALLPGAPARPCDLPEGKRSERPGPRPRGGEGGDDEGHQHVMAQDPEMPEAGAAGPQVVLRVERKPPEGPPRVRRELPVDDGARRVRGTQRQREKPLQEDEVLRGPERRESAGP